MRSKFLPALLPIVLGTCGACLFPVAANALTTAYQYDAPNFSYSFCNNFAQGGKQCPGQFQETLDFDPIFVFSFDPSTQTTFSLANAVIAKRTVEKTGLNQPQLIFTSGSYSSQTNILTFTGPNITYGQGSNAVTVPVFYSVFLPSGLPDNGNVNNIINDAQFRSIGTVCVKWQDNGNSNCEPADLRAIPNPISALALVPLAFLGRLRQRYRSKIPSA